QASGRSATQQRVTRPQPEGNPGAAPVEHHADAPAWPQDAQGLGDRSGGVRRVVQDAPRVDDVEAVVLERKTLGIRLPDVAVQPLEPYAAADELDRVIGQVH